MKNCRVHPTHWLISTQVACLATSQSLGFDASNLYAFNMFARKPRDFQEGLFSALKRFVGSAAIKKRAYNRAWKKCATH